MAWLFFFYSLIGWIVESSIIIIFDKPIKGRGFLSTPFCYLYGLAAVVMTAALQNVKAYPVLLFLCCTAIGTLMQLLTAFLLKKAGIRQWWDYSGKRFHYKGMICLRYSLIWGLLGFLAVMWVNDFVLTLFIGLNWLARAVIIVLILCTIAGDLIGNLFLRFGRERMPSFLYRFNRSLDTFTVKTGNGLKFIIGEKKEERLQYRAILWVFLISSFLGCMVETVFCRFSMGYWMNRSSLVFGQMSMVWGLGILLATVVLRRFQEKPAWRIFLIGTVIGSVFEYVCSVATEMAFGLVFWDYLDFRFNVAGRINLGFGFLWGVAAVIWIKLLYKPISIFIRFLIDKTGRWLSAVALILLFVDIIISCMALSRYTERDAAAAQDTVSAQESASTQDAASGQNASSVQGAASGQNASSVQGAASGQDTSSVQGAASGQDTSSVQDAASGQDTSSAQSGVSGPDTSSVQSAEPAQDTSSVQSAASETLMDQLFPDNVMEVIYPKETVHAPEKGLDDIHSLQ